MGRLRSVKIENGCTTSVFVPAMWRKEIDTIIATRRDIYPSRNQFMRAAIFKEIRRCQEEDKIREIEIKQKNKKNRKKRKF